MFSLYQIKTQARRCDAFLVLLATIIVYQDASSKAKNHGPWQYLSRGTQTSTLMLSWVLCICTTKKPKMLTMLLARGCETPKCATSHSPGNETRSSAVSVFMAAQEGGSDLLLCLSKQVIVACIGSRLEGAGDGRFGVEGTWIHQRHPSQSSINATHIRKTP